MVSPFKQKPFSTRSLHPTANVTPISEQFQHFFESVHEDFCGSLYDRTKQAWKNSPEEEPRRERDRYCGLGWYERDAGQERH